MPVYMIRAGQHGPIKIGFSKDVTFRLVKMQADNHERLQVMRVFEGGAAEEAMLHERFADSRLHGEWFKFSKAMLGDLGLQEAITTPEELTAALRKLAIASRAAAARRSPPRQPTEEEQALLTEELRGLVAASKEVKHRMTFA